MNLIFLGPPGAGKGTVAAKVSEELNIPHISTGDLFRAAIKNQTPLGVKVKKILDSGELVPDQVTTDMVQERLESDDAKNGFIMDGFPRTIPQADSFSKITNVKAVINFEIADSEVIDRLSGRRVCRSCGSTFHTKFMPPKNEGKCDSCDGELYTRDDDKKEAILNRLEVYKKQTQPLIDYYSDKNLLHNIDADNKPQSVLESTIKKLKEI